MAIAKRLFGVLGAVGLVLAAISILPALPKPLEEIKSWPQGTQFALVDAKGQVVWQPGSEPTQAALAKAVALRITLPNGTSYLVAVKVVGKGQGLGEVQLTVGGKTVPLPELLHAKGFALEGGKLVRLKGSEEGADQGKKASEESSGTGKEASQPGAKGKGK